MSPEVDLTNWPTEAQVAQMLGISRRTLSRETEKRLWQPRTRSRHGKKPEIVYDPDQVAARMPPARSSLVKADPLTNFDNTDSLSELSELPELTWPNIVQYLSALMAESQQSQAQQPPQRFVNVKAAAEITGLSQSCIRRLMRDGKLQYLTDHNAWLTSRDALESFDPFAPSPAKKGHK